MTSPRVKRAVAAGLTIGSVATLPAVVSPAPAFANHNGCRTGYACFWQVNGYWGGNFAGTTAQLDPAFPAKKGYSHGTTGLRACGFRNVSWDNLEFSLLPGETKTWNPDQPNINTVVSSSKWVDGFCS